MKGHIVRDMRVLNAMARRGLVTLEDNTGENVWYAGQMVKSYYVLGYGPNAQPNARQCLGFIYKGLQHEIQRFSGCFYPYVVCISNKED